MGFAALEPDEIEAGTDFLARFVAVERGRDEVVLDGEAANRRLDRAGGAQRVAVLGLGAADRGRLSAEEF